MDSNQNSKTTSLPSLLLKLHHENMTGMVTVKGQQRAIEIYGNVAKQGKTTEGRLILLTSFNKLIIANTILLLAADFSHFIGFLGPDLTYILRMIFRLAAMCAIAFGGLRLITT